MTIYIVTRDVSETSTPCGEYCESFATRKEAEEYVKREAAFDSYEGWDQTLNYEIVEKTF